MKKVVKKTNKKKKKKVSFAKRLFKTIGICTASVFGFLGVSLGIYALCGGFKEKVVDLLGMKFEQPAYVLSGDAVSFVDENVTKKVVGYKNSYGEIFETVKLLPTNEDATKLDIVLYDKVLSGGTSLVKFAENNKVGSPLKFEILQENDYNKSGEFVLRAVQDESQLADETRIFIESEVKSITSKITNASGDFNKNSIYPGHIFQISIPSENIYPQNSLNTPKDCNNADNVFYAVYGKDYFKKQILYYSSANEIASVNETTGEVTVHKPGSFTITCYMAKTFKQNAEINAINRNELTDKEYFEQLGNLCAIRSESFVAKDIEVAGLTVTGDLSLNPLEVFNTYKYSVNGEYSASDNAINLNFVLSKPAGADFGDVNLDYRLSDIQLFEGILKDGKYYITKQIYGKTTQSGQEGGVINENVILSEHLTITKNINPLTYSVRVNSYTSQDIYLIARIGNKNLDLSTCFVDGQNFDCSKDKTAFYAGTKISLKTQKVDQNLSFNAAKILAQFNNDGGEDSGFLYISNNKLLDLTNSDLFSNPKSSQTFNKVKYFIRLNNEGEQPVLVCTGYYDGINPEIQLYSKIKIADENGSHFEFIEDSNGKYVKLNNLELDEAIEFDIYAKIFEYKYKIQDDGNFEYETDNDGNILLDENDNPIKVVEYYFDENDATKYAKSTGDESNALKVLISQSIVLSNFVFNPEFDQDTGNNKSISINKGETLRISFNATNISGLKTAIEAGLFNINCSVNDLISIGTPIYNGNTCSFDITAVKQGMGVITMLFNGEPVTIQSQNSANKFTQFDLNIGNNDVKSIEITGTDVVALREDLSELSFVVTGDGDDIKFKTASSTNMSQELSLGFDGGVNSTRLYLEALSDDISIFYGTKDDYSNHKPSGKIELVVKENLTIEDINKGEFITVYPHKLCSDLKFYVYALVEGNQQIKSQTLSISVSLPSGFKISQNKNVNNKITINGTDYEKVIGGEAFKIVGESGAGNIDSYLSIGGDDEKLKNALSNLGKNSVWSVPEIVDNKNISHALYTSEDKFYDVKENTICQIVFKPSCLEESQWIKYNFYIIPQRIVRTQTIEMNAGETKEVSELVQNVELWTRQYSSEKPDSSEKSKSVYAGNISESKNATALSTDNVKFYKNNHEIVGSYQAPDSFMGDTDTILCEITITNINNETKTYTGILNININSNYSIKQQRGQKDDNLALINNGEIINLTDLFKIERSSDKALTDVKKVELKQESFDKLKLYGVKMLNDSGEETAVLSQIVKLQFPQDFNIFEIDELFADITGVVNKEEKTQTNFEFSLNFVLTELNVKDSTIYLLANEIEANGANLTSEGKSNVISNYVVLAQKSTQTGDPKDIKNDIALSLERNAKGEVVYIIFTLNNITIKKDCTVLSGNILAKKLNTEFVIAKAYKISDLFEISNADNQTIVEAFENATFVGIKELKLDEYKIISDSKILIVNKQQTCTISIKMLNRIFEIQGFEFQAINAHFEGVGELYSNLEYEIFDKKNLDKILDHNLNVSVKIKNADDSTCLDVQYVSNSDGTFSNKIKVSNYQQTSSKSVTVLLTIGTSGYVGYELKKTFVLHSLNITAIYDGITYNGNQILINQFNYDLTKYYKITSTNQSLNLKTFIKNIEVENLENYLVNESADTTINLTFNVSTSAGLLKTVATVPFFVKVYTLTVKQSSEIYYVGQTLSESELLQLVEIIDISGNVIVNEDIRAKIKIESTISELISGDNSFDVSFGGQTKSITIKAILANFRAETSYNIYPDTKISRYISCYVTDESNNQRALSLNYKFDITSDSSSSVSENDGIITLKQNSVVVALLDKQTGVITIPSSVESDTSFYVVAYIEGTSLETINSNTSRTILFNISTPTKYLSADSQNIYVGDQEYDLSQFAHFVLNGNVQSPDFEVASILDSQNNGYTFTENKNTKEIVINKNGTTYAKIKFKDGNRCVLETSSELDALVIKLKGYLSITSASGYTVESTRNDYIELTINLISIEVDFGGSVFEIDGKSYNIITSETNYALSPTITGGNNATLSLSNVTLFDGFIGKIHNPVAMSFSKILQQLSIEQDSKKTKLPNGTSIEITDKKDGSKHSYGFAFNPELVDYVFLTINYCVNDIYNSKAYICLKPNLNISFEYDNATTNYASIYSPSNYNISNDSALLSFNGDIKSNNIVEVSNNQSYKFSIDFSGEIQNNTELSETLFETSSSTYHILTLEKNSSGYVISIDNDLTKESRDCYYCMRVTIKDTNDDSKVYKYYFLIYVTSINVQIKDDSGRTVDTTNPLVITTPQSLDLKQYVYVNENKIETNEIFFNNIIFVEQNNNQYSVNKNGIFTLKTAALEKTVISFSLFNKIYSIYVKGQELSVLFKENGLTKSDDFTFNKGETKYIYFEQNQIEQGKKEIVVDVENNISAGTAIPSDIILNLTIRSYEFAGTTYTDENVFTYETDGNTTTYSFMGSVLLTLTRNESCYQLEISSNISGNLIFELAPNYQTLKVQKLCKVNADVSIDINYINPSIYEDRNYQNVLSGTSFDLTNIVSTNKTGASYQIESGANSYVSLSGSSITIFDGLQNPVYLKIKVSLNGTINYVYVKAVPTKITNILNNQSAFSLLLGETVNLLDYVKIQNFVGFDSQNEPLYEYLTKFNIINADNSKTLISDPYNFVVDDRKTTIEIDERTFILNAIKLSFEAQTCFIGEQLNLNEVVKNKIQSSTLSNKNMLIEFDLTSGIVTSNGIFTTNDKGTYEVKVLINNVEDKLTVIVEDLSIEVLHKSSVICNDELTNQSKKYENVYAGQNEKNLDEYIKISQTNNYANKLQFSVSVEKSVEYNGNSYDINKFSTRNSNIKGLNTIVVYYNNIAIFAIGNDGFVCYHDFDNANNQLKYEVLLNIDITLENNSAVKNNFNVRLLPIKISVVSDADLTKSNFIENSGNYEYNLFNLFNVSTNANENNLTLARAIEFYDNSSTPNTKLENGLLKISTGVGGTTQKQITATFGGRTFPIDIKINLEKGNVSESLFKNPISTDSGCFDSDSGVSIVGIFGIHNEINYTLSVENGMIFYYVYNNNSDLLFKIGGNGEFSEVSNIKTEVYLIASKMEGESSQRLEFKMFSTGDATSINFVSNGYNYVQENGTMVLELVSGEKCGLTNFLNGATIVGNAYPALTIESKIIVVNGVTTTTYSIVANEVTTTTYGYFDAQKGSLITRVYVKVYPYYLSQVVANDFTFKGAEQLDGTSKAIGKNDGFVTLYATKNSTTNLSSIKINLNTIIKKVSDGKITSDIGYNIERVVNVSGDGDSLEYKIVSNDNRSDYVSLNGEELEVKANGTYYVYMSASINEKQKIYFAFRVLQVESKFEGGEIEVENKASIDAESLIKVYAEVKDYEKSGSQNQIDLLNKLDIKFENSFGTTFDANKIIFNEQDFEKLTTTTESEKLGHQIKLVYSYQNLKNEVNILVLKNKSTDDSGKNLFNKNNTLYKELYNGDENFEQKISNSDSESKFVVKNATISGATYNAVLEKGSINGTNVSYYNISNMLKIETGGKIWFKNPNYSAENGEDEYILQNKIGVILLLIQSEKSVNYNTKISESEVTVAITAYVDVNYKLNNYSITKDSFGNYSYSLNGEKVQNSLKFGLILQNSDGEFVNSLTIKDDDNNPIPISISRNSRNINCNGITLNSISGAVFGTKTYNKDFKMFVVAFVDEIGSNLIDNFVLFEI